jgi:hypothetical protein
MTHSESIAALAAALAAAQGELAPVAFDRDNPFFKSRYATLTALREAMRPVFAKHGLSIIQGAGPDGGIETTILHASGEWITAAGLPMRPVKDDPQGIGSLLTYARRYGLAAAAGLVADEDDDGNGATHGKAPERPQDASTPARDTRHAEPPKGVNAEPSGVNAGALPKDKGDCVLTGKIRGSITPDTKHGKAGDHEVAYFDLLLDDGTIYLCTAWHEARDAALSMHMGDFVDVVGRWNVWNGKVKVDVSAITLQSSEVDDEDPLPF